VRHRYLIADVFTDRVFGGNPLAVFPDAGQVPASQMQRVAREMNLSETVFVLPPEMPEGTRRVRIFTPTLEMPFAGHPTLGTAFILAAIGAVPLEGEETDIVLEEGVGPVSVRIETSGGQPTRTELTAARTPEAGPPAPPREAVAAALSLDLEDLAPVGDATQSFSCGVPYLFVAVRDRSALARARVARGPWEQAIAETWAPSVYVYTPDASPGFDFRARMFAPGHGVEEDPATGSAAAAFAGVTQARLAGPDDRVGCAIEQGVEMGRPSRLDLSVERSGGALLPPRVSGASVLVAEGEMEIPAD